MHDPNAALLPALDHLEKTGDFQQSHGPMLIARIRDLEAQLAAAREDLSSERAVVGRSVLRLVKEADRDGGTVEIGRDGARLQDAIRMLFARGMRSRIHGVVRYEFQATDRARVEFERASGMRLDEIFPVEFELVPEDASFLPAVKLGNRIDASIAKHYEDLCRKNKITSQRYRTRVIAVHHDPCKAESCYDLESGYSCVFDRFNNLVVAGETTGPWRCGWGFPLPTISADTDRPARVERPAF